MRLAANDSAAYVEAYCTLFKRIYDEVRQKPRDAVRRHKHFIHHYNDNWNNKTRGFSLTYSSIVHFLCGMIDADEEKREYLRSYMDTTSHGRNRWSMSKEESKAFDTEYGLHLFS